MRRKHIHKLFVLGVTLFTMLTSCEKNIDFKLNTVTDQVVVDASIENGQLPVVVLTKSFSYFSSINPQLLESSFLHGAQVIVSDGLQTQKLKEDTVTIAPGYQLYYYTIDTINTPSPIRGQLNTTYKLDVFYAGQHYDATTTIPYIYKRPDSLWWKPAPQNPDTNKVVVMVQATDPPGLGNYVRYYTKRNSQSFYPGPNSVFDDQVIDGTTYQIQVIPGVNRNEKIDPEDNFFFKGDSVTLKLSSIDKTTYTFWNTMEFNYASIGNPFASPNKVIGNVSNGALGAFCGYASAYRTLIIPR
jgi:hypothetical protein